jgi:hypothetical protein
VDPSRVSDDGGLLVCADCGRAILWQSDEAAEWPTVEDGAAFRTVCVDCYRARYGDDEAEESARRTRDEQRDDRGP